MEAIKPRRDPPVRKDGKCAQCKKARPLAVKSPYGGNQAILDPFCSTGCCREWHDKTLPKALGRPGINRERVSATGT